MAILYNISIFIYRLTILLASPFNKKAELWIRGRKDVFEKLDREVMPGSGNVWVHCASLGEFEQCRPVIEEIKKNLPGKKIVLTFFSPSGYEIRKNYELADCICYLPTDFPKNAKRFLWMVEPEAAVFVKYDLWYNYITLLHKKSIPTYLISANFRPGQVFFKWYGGMFRKLLKKLTHIFVQNKSSAEMLKKIEIMNVTVAGDIRFDRALATVANIRPLPVIEAFTGDALTFIAGSTWPKDEELIVSYINGLPSGDGVRFILAPHVVKKENIDRIAGQIQKKLIRYSGANEENVKENEVLIIDNIGLLASAYQYGHVAYVGGGFGRNLHNVQEATTFGLPVIIGPYHFKYPEVAEMIKMKIVFSVSTPEEFKLKFDELRYNDELRKEIYSDAKSFVSERSGATNLIFNRLSTDLAKE